MSPIVQRDPEWDRLYDTAATQAGFFTTRQAADAGFSDQLLLHHVRADNIRRVHRGIYRLVRFPASEHEELVVAWLWSDMAGVISHHTALALHDLSDVLPAQIHLTLPASWRRRRLRTPAHVLLYYTDIPPEDRAWFGAVPTTNARRTLNDCATAGLSPELLRQAAQQALRRGIVTQVEIRPVEEALKPFGGLAT
jgi:predicted transcriptional regulator of viral defense system